MSPLDTAVLTIGLSLTAVLTYGALSLTAVLTYGALSLYVAANRPGDRPTWGDFFEFVAGIAHEVRAGFQRIGHGERKA